MTTQIETMKTLLANAPMKPKVKFLDPAKASKEIKKTIAKGTTTAKTATSPTSKRLFAAKLKKAKAVQSKLTAPGEFARCRAIAGGDLRAGALLYRIAYLWRSIQGRMIVGGEEFLAMTQADWGMSAGLNESETTKYAFPRLKKYASDIVKIAVHGRGSAKKTYIRLNEEAYQSALGAEGFELKISAQNGVSLYS